MEEKKMPKHVRVFKEEKMTISKRKWKKQGIYDTRHEQKRLINEHSKMILLR